MGAWVILMPLCWMSPKLISSVIGGSQARIALVPKTEQTHEF
jgi:hypothetical protein